MAHTTEVSSGVSKKTLAAANGIGGKGQPNEILILEKSQRLLWAGVGTEAPPRTRVWDISGVFGRFAIFGYVGALTD